MDIELGFKTAPEALTEIARQVPGYVRIEQIGESGWVIPSSEAAISAKG
jgi:hypothetical protein